MSSCPCRRHGRDRRATETGALAIEAALVFPFILLLLAGIVEWSLVLRDQIEVTSLARAGARTASALAPAHPWVAPAVPFTGQVVDSMVRAASSLPLGSVRYILVYEANAQGFPGSSGSTVMSCAGTEATCDRYDWDPVANNGLGGFVRAAGTGWTGQDINSCLGSGGMSVGVYLASDHQMLTGLFGSTKQLAASTVMRFEPRSPGRCSP